MEVAVISGTHKGKTGKTIGIFKEANTCVVEFDDGTVAKVKISETVPRTE